MFKFFIISAWTVAIAASASIAMFVALSLTFSIWSTSSESLLNIFNSIALQKYITFLTNDSQFLISSSNLENGEWQVFVTIGLISAIGVSMIVISIIELLRMKKAQKISKPFIKVYIVIISVLSLLVGQVILIIGGTLLLFTFVLLEVLLFDSEALNNFAEERNLIAIYKEERKFEREVSKEGKLIDSTDLIQKNQINFQSKIEQEKVNDNLVLSVENQKDLDKYFKNSKLKNNYFKWKKIKQSLIDTKKEFENMDLKNLNPKQLKKVLDFNNKVLNSNEMARNLNIPEFYQMSYLIIGELSNKNDINLNFEVSEINSNKKEDVLFQEEITLESKSFNSTSNSFIKEQDIKSIDEEDEIYNSYSQMDEEINKLLSSEVKTSTIMKGFDDKFVLSKMKRAINMDLNQLLKIDSSFTNEQEMLEDFGFRNFEIINNSYENSFQFTLIENLKENNEVLNGKNLQKNLNESFIQNNKLLPEIIEIKNLNEELIIEEEQNDALNVNFNQLEINSLISSNINEIYEDFNFEQPDLTLDVFNQQDLEKNVNKSLFANKIDFVATAKPIIDQNNLEFEEKEFEEFIIPNSKKTKSKIENSEDKFAIENMARAINIDLNQLNESYVSNLKEHEIYNDFKIEDELLASEMLIKQLENTKKYKIDLLLKQNIKEGTSSSLLENQNLDQIKKETSLIQEKLVNNISLSENENTELQFIEDSNLENILLDQKENKLYENEIELEDFDDNFINIEFNNSSELEEVCFCEEKNEKLQNIEERITSLEKLIYSIDIEYENKKIHDEFMKLSQKIELLSKTINELENSNPKSIIDSLTIRHVYNKK
ncbi:hypothetical protein [Spiroplasma taiwanense]|uniref:Transmembrane protein n=1 Tax=Spiroplasma taiwanense CT-1 TaxID=1276220 RepID=S5MIB1_9MOLU|nr:hypothetical protein [Spiroplasma taiwanense]AGR41640.1 hypothetical protein STAIW_v1c10570 [Spiroplasma taiwanense CT-1]